MQFVVLLCGGHTHQAIILNIIVHTVDIGISMVDHIVFHIPHKLAGAHHTARSGSDLIHRFAFATSFHDCHLHYKKPIEAIIQPSREHSNTPQYHAGSKITASADRSRQTQHQHNGFMPEGEISGLFDIVLCKILLNPVL